MLLVEFFLKIPIIYVGGYGRSGSTALERMLGTDLNALCCGESSAAFDAERKTGATHCSCGSLPLNCDFWGELYVEGMQVIGRTDPKALNADFQNVDYHYAKVSEEKREEYARFWQAVYAGALRKSNTACIIDSSKTARGKARSLVFARSGLFDVVVLHLIRHPYDVIRSREKGINVQGGLRPSGPLVLPRTVGGWLTANRFARYVGQDENAQYFSVRYSALAEHRESIGLRLASWLQSSHGHSPEDLSGDGRGLSHQIAGNRMSGQNQDAFKLEITSNSSLSPIRTLTGRLLGYDGATFDFG